MTPALVECTVYGWEIGDTIVYTLEVVPALEKSPGNGYGSCPNHVTEAREMCCLHRGPISSGVNPICKIGEHYY